jgi:hypothetical protein
MDSIQEAKGGVTAHRSGALRWAGAAALATAAIVPLTGVAAADGPDGLPVFSEAHFSHPTTIDNPFLPLVPGNQLVFVGTANRGQGQGTHRIVFTVTDMVKEVDGIETVVVWDRDFQDGALAEAELSLWAQDDAGNVWNLGEYPEEWDARRFAGAPSTWVSGYAGALGGIHVHGRPVVGSPAYVQGDAPAISFLDHARVAALGIEACTPVGCFGDVLVVDEWDPLAQPADGHQLKHYAPGRGPVRVEPVGGEEQETLVLTEHRTVDTATLDRIREAALRLDERAYRFQPRVWSTTSPAEQD